MARKDVVILEGLVEVNPYGDWDDVDKGTYVDRDNIANLLWDYKGRNVRVTIEVIEEEN